MHGRVKVRTTEEKERIMRAEKQKKAREFKDCYLLAMKMRKAGELDDELADITKKLLYHHPDVYTLWNVRREILLSDRLSSSGELLEKALEDELALTEACLRENPKSYCVWHQREWVIERMKEPNWKRELALCQKCLELDERNFHCWDYRRFVAKKAELTPQAELNFTTNKIENNFSNYSSWHYRSKLLEQLHGNRLGDAANQQVYNNEIDLVMNATFTDPSDTSTWFYQRWLLNYWKTPPQLWCIKLHKNFITVVFHKQVSSSSLKLLFKDKQGDGCQWSWQSVNGKMYSPIWFVDLGELKPENLDNFIVEFEGKSYSTSDEKTLTDSRDVSKLKEQLSNYKELIELEPSNKWAKLTVAQLMLDLDENSNYSSIISILEELIQVDPLRSNYYKDMLSKCKVKHKLNSVISDPYGYDRDTAIDLSNLDLTTLGGCESYLTFCSKINLQFNLLSNEVLYQLYCLQQCKSLNLSQNNLTSLKSFPILHNLENLVLYPNEITDLEASDILKKHATKKLVIAGNSDEELTKNEMKK
ncbi:hypothetical protein TKK_0003323 [Trichogramma kaykai]